jgi:quinol monooxygenase YgiN
MELFGFIRFHAIAGSEEALAEAFNDVIVSSRQEPGCLRIHAFRSTRDPRLFYIHSHWRDEAAFDLHGTLPHTRHFLERVQPLIDHPLEFTRTQLFA